MLVEVLERIGTPRAGVRGFCELAVSLGTEFMASEMVARRNIHLATIKPP